MSQFYERNLSCILTLESKSSI
ncbi:hypothetical protein Avbf_17410 [Armadillidium vulgare]|nr:hypothetical protein Avbf_17410 [Armadillidium vulgare]